MNIRIFILVSALLSTLPAMAENITCTQFSDPNPITGVSAKPGFVAETQFTTSDYNPRSCLDQTNCNLSATIYRLNLYQQGKLVGSFANSAGAFTMNGDVNCMEGDGEGCDINLAQSTLPAVQALGTYRHNGGGYSFVKFQGEIYTMNCQ